MSDRDKVILQDVSAVFPGGSAILRNTTVADVQPERYPLYSVRPVQEKSVPSFTKTRSI